jgi:hypothetical protein
MTQSVVDNHFRSASSREISARKKSDTEVMLCVNDCADRQALERYIANKFLQVHDAHVNEYLTIIVGVNDGEQILGAFGLRPGQYRPMFLEQYLDTPIEQQVALISTQLVDRHALMEVGNLAIASQKFGPTAMVLMAMSLAEAGYEWMVFTVTLQVEKLMKRLGFKPHYLASADPHRLKGDQSLWGSYYDNNPQVMVGSVKVAADVIASNKYLNDIANQQRDNISTLAIALCDYRRLRVAS